MKDFLKNRKTPKHLSNFILIKLLPKTILKYLLVSPFFQDFNLLLSFINNDRRTARSDTQSKRLLVFVDSHK